MNYSRALISRIGIVKWGKYDQTTEDAARRARARNVGRALSLPNMAASWRDGAHAGYAAALLPIAVQSWQDGRSVEHLRELLVERIIAGLSNDCSDCAAEFREGVIYGYAFDPGKTLRGKPRTGRGDDKTARLARFADEHFDELLACCDSGEAYKLVRKHFPRIVESWEADELKRAVWRIRQLLHRELGLSLGKRGRPRVDPQ